MQGKIAHRGHIRGQYRQTEGAGIRHFGRYLILRNWMRGILQQNNTVCRDDPGGQILEGAIGVIDDPRPLVAVKFVADTAIPDITNKMQDKPLVRQFGQSPGDVEHALVRAGSSDKNQREIRGVHPHPVAFARPVKAGWVKDLLITGMSDHGAAKPIAQRYVGHHKGVRIADDPITGPGRQVRHRAQAAPPILPLPACPATPCFHP